MGHMSVEWLIGALHRDPTVRALMLSPDGCTLQPGDGQPLYVARLLPHGDPLSPFSEREPTLVIRDARREPA